jgi:uncharacterized protein (DUF1684 family)
MELASDAGGGQDVIELGELRMWVIERGGRFAIRLRDFNAARYKNYKGLKFYRPREELRVKAEYVPFEIPKILKLATMVGTEAEMISPGYLTFRLDGRDLRLDVFGEPESNELFIILRDETSGDETYGACRYMTASLLEDGAVDLNFNRAHNPPCAYTPYATCPLPPPQNELPVRIEAGEKRYTKGHVAH